MYYRARKEGYPKIREDFSITEKAPTRAFSWFKVPTSAFTFKTLLRHYAKQTLTQGKPEKGSGRGLLRDYEPFCGPSFQALMY